jgi:hypothetical protein
MIDSRGGQAVDRLTGVTGYSRHAQGIAFITKWSHQNRTVINRSKHADDEPCTIIPITEKNDDFGSGFLMHRL